MEASHFESFFYELGVAAAVDAIIIDLNWCPRLLSMWIQKLIVYPI
jgi:hypothetical protein